MPLIKVGQVSTNGNLASAKKLQFPLTSFAEQDAPNEVPSLFLGFTGEINVGGATPQYSLADLSDGMTDLSLTFGDDQGVPNSLNADGIELTILQELAFRQRLPGNRIFDSVEDQDVEDAPLVFIPLTPPSLGGERTLAPYAAMFSGKTLNLTYNPDRIDNVVHFNGTFYLYADVRRGDDRKDITPTAMRVYSVDTLTSETWSSPVGERVHQAYLLDHSNFDAFTVSARQGGKLISTAEDSSKELLKLQQVGRFSQVRIPDAGLDEGGKFAGIDPFTSYVVNGTTYDVVPVFDDRNDVKENEGIQIRFHGKTGNDMKLVVVASKSPATAS